MSMLRHSISTSIPDQRNIITGARSTTLDRALSVLSGGKRSLSRSPSPIHPDIVQRTQDLLDICFTFYFPNPDSPTYSKHNEAIDETLSPLVILLTRLCKADAVTRQRISDWIVPDHLDRSPHRPLEARNDFLGRCLRILQAHGGRLKESIGELLYAMCGEDAWVLSSKVGYGNVAGFLFNKGILSAPPPPLTTTSTTDGINPITGTEFTTPRPSSSTPEMTEEEKEAEMDKLLVLFDRLERAGPRPKVKVKG